MAKRTTKTSASYLTPEDLKLLAKIKGCQVEDVKPDNSPTVKIGDLVIFRKHTDQWDKESNIGLVIKLYDNGAFYVKIIKRTTCSTKKWARFGTLFEGNYINSKYYEWRVLKSCWTESYTVHNDRTVFHIAKSANPKQQGLTNERHDLSSSETIDIYVISESDFDSPFKNEQYIYAMINNSFGEFEKVKNINNFNDYKANAVRKARINKLLFQMKG